MGGASGDSRSTRCFFFDLGANEGDSALVFLNHPSASLKMRNALQGGFRGYQPSGCKAFLFEPNPRWEPVLQEIAMQHPNIVALTKTAAWRCDEEVDIYVPANVGVHTVASLMSGVPDSRGQKL